MGSSKQPSSQMLSLASEVLCDRSSSPQAKLLAATVLAEVPLPTVRRGRTSSSQQHAPAPL
jgi:hypothetical protein